MKKLLAAILAIIFIFSLASCGIKIEENDDNEPEPFDLEAALAELAETQIEIAEASDAGLIAPAKDSEEDLYGYVDIKGNWIIPAAYVETKEATNGCGICLNNYSQYLYVNKDNTVAFEKCKGKYLSECNHFSEGLLVTALNMSADQKYLYVDESYNPVITASKLPKVSWRNYPNSDYFAVATPFVSGLAVVMRMKNADIKDSCGPETAYIIKKTGEIAAKLPSGLDPYSNGFDNNGNIIVCNKENRFGLCDDEGNLVMECKFRSLKHCDGSLYLACDDNGFWGFVDSKGDTVIDFQYQKAMPFSEGLAAVFDGNHWGFIKTDGSTGIEFVFDDVAMLNDSEIDSSLNKAAFKDGVAAVKAYDCWAIIDAQEQPLAVLTKEDCSVVEGCPFVGVSNGYITFAKTVNGKAVYGVLDMVGRQILKPQFAYLGCFN